MRVLSGSDKTKFQRALHSVEMCPEIDGHVILPFPMSRVVDSVCSRESLMLSFRRAIFCSAGVFATLALSTGIASAGPILDYQMTTAGCFNCTTAGGFTDIVSYSGYTFDGVTMSSGVTDASGNATVSLGTLARNNVNYSQSANWE